MAAEKRDADAAVKQAVDVETMAEDAGFLPETVLLAEIPAAVFSGSLFLCASAETATAITAVDATAAATAAGSF